MTFPKEPGDYLLQDEWGLYTTATLFPSGRMAYKEWHFSKEEALKDATRKYTTRGAFVLPGDSVKVVEKLNNK